MTFFFFLLDFRTEKRPRGITGSINSSRASNLLLMAPDSRCPKRRNPRKICRRVSAFGPSPLPLLFIARDHRTTPRHSDDPLGSPLLTTIPTAPSAEPSRRVSPGFIFNIRHNQEVLRGFTFLSWTFSSLCSRLAVLPDSFNLGRCHGTRSRLTYWAVRPPSLKIFFFSTERSTPNHLCLELQ